jgi:hypothetical protein
MPAGTPKKMKLWLHLSTRMVIASKCQCFNDCKLVNRSIFWH